LTSLELEAAVEAFKKDHPLLIAQAKKDPAFAEAWDRAVRYRVMHPPPTTSAKRLVQVRADHRRALRRLEVEARAAQSREDEEIRAQVQATRERQRLDDLERVAKEQAEAERLDVLNSLNAIPLPAPLSPADEQAFRMRMIAEVERRATETGPDDPQASDG
jgi:hypothetical protein